MTMIPSFNQFDSVAPTKKPRIKFRFLIGALLLIAIGVQFVATAAADQSRRATLATRRVRAMEDLLGPRGMDFLCGAVFLGLGCYCAFNSARTAGRKGRIVVISACVLVALAVASVWIVPAIMHRNTVSPPARIGVH
jgi:hypothetical protein